MWGILGFVLLIVISIAFGSITQWLQNQKLAEQERNARKRAEQQRTTRPLGEADSTVDRYVEEVERLRRRTPGTPRAMPTAVPETPVVVPVAKRKRLGDDAFTPLRPMASRLDDLPVAAPVIATPARPPGTVVEAGAARSGIAGPFAAMLKSKDGLAMAVLLSEVFGPPRSKRM